MKKKRSFTHTWEDPLILAESAKTMSGLDYLQAMIDKTIPEPPICSLIDFRLVEVHVGQAIFELTPAEHHYNPFGVVQGGIPATLLEAATACAVHSALEKGIGFTTMEVKFNLVRPITKGSGKMRCEGKVLHMGSQTALAEGRLTDAKGVLYAYATSTCMILQSGWK